MPNFSRCLRNSGKLDSLSKSVHTVWTVSVSKTFRVERETLRSVNRPAASKPSLLHTYMDTWCQSTELFWPFYLHGVQVSESISNFFTIFFLLFALYAYNCRAMSVFISHLRTFSFCMSWWLQLWWTLFFSRRTFIIVLPFYFLYTYGVNNYHFCRSCFSSRSHHVHVSLQHTRARARTHSVWIVNA